jgi:hypothetical protein
MAKVLKYFIYVFILILIGIGGFLLGMRFAKSSSANSSSLWNICIPQANSRDTYFTIHNINEAHKYSKGKGIKIGILDWGFGFSKHRALYAGGECFNGYRDNFDENSEHGYWMASVLKEIAPECEVYALGTFIPNDETSWIDAMAKGINWAIENNIDILTLSHQQITNKNRDRFDAIVNKAITNNIATTFIHYDNPNNILPYMLGNRHSYKRAPDINIFHYDYNTLLINEYMNYLEKGDEAAKSRLYLSLSSTSPVTAGFIAILKSINGRLTPREYKNILVQTSYQMEYNGEYADHVVDIGSAVRYLMEQY